MPKRKLQDTVEWSSHKDVIIQLYMNEDKALPDVMQIMASRGFARTKPQYERTFKLWGVSKNIREVEWKFIFNRLEERQRLRKMSAVHVRGVSISDTKLKRQKTKLRQTAFDQFIAQRAARPSTPPGVKVFTPPSTPKCEAEPSSGAIVSANFDDTKDDEEGDLILPIRIHARECEEEPYLRRPTPFNVSRVEFPFEWLQPSAKSVRNDLSFSLPPFTESLEQRVMHHDCTDVRTDLGMQSSLLKWFSGVFSVPSIDQTQNFLDLTALQEAGARISTATIDLLLRKMILENLSTGDAPILMIGRARNVADLQALRSLLRLRGDISTTLQAFSQRLVLLAIMEGNFPLVKILLEAGVDPNTRTRVWKEAGGTTSDMGGSGFDDPNMTALHIAVYQRREDIVGLLLRHGATDWRAELQGAKGYVTGSILDVIKKSMASTGSG